MSEIEAGIAALRARFVTRSREDLEALRGWAHAGARPDADHHRILHRLSGAAGTFGFHALSARAKAVEDQLPDAASVAGRELSALLDELARVAAGGA